MIPLLTLTAIDPHRCDISLPNSNSTCDLYSHFFRLPLYQGSYSGYLIPLLTLTAIDPHRCDISLPNSNSTGDLYSHLF